MAVVIRLQGLPIVAGTMDIRHFFSGLTIPDGGVHIVGGELGEAFIVFATDEDARLGMMRTGGTIKGSKVSLLLSSKTEMQNMIEQSRRRFETASVDLPPANSSRSGPPPNTGIGTSPAMTRVNLPTTVSSFSNPPTSTVTAVTSVPESNKNITTFSTASIGTTPPNLGAPFCNPTFSSTMSSVAAPLATVPPPPIPPLPTMPTLPTLPPMPSMPPMNVPPPVPTLPPVPPVPPIPPVPPVPPMAPIPPMSGMPPMNPPPVAPMPAGINGSGSLLPSNMNPLFLGPLNAMQPNPTNTMKSHHINQDDPYVCLGGLPFPVSENDIKDFFHGLRVEGVILLKDHMGRLTGSALVKLLTPHDSYEALKRNRMLMGQRFVEVTPATERQWVLSGGYNAKQSLGPPGLPHFLQQSLPRSKSPSGQQRSRSRSPHEHGYCVYLKGLPYEAENKHLIEFFKNLDIIEDSIYIAYGPNGKATGEGFLEFKNEVDYKTALCRHKQHMGNRFIQVHPITKKTMFEKIDMIRKKLQSFNYIDNKDRPLNIEAEQHVHRMCGHLSNLPYSVTRHEVLQFFLMEGVGVDENSVHVLTDTNGQGLGQALVQFRSEEDARKSEHLHRKQLNGRDAFLHLISTEERKEIEKSPPMQGRKGFKMPMHNPPLSLGINSGGDEFCLLNTSVKDTNSGPNFNFPSNFSGPNNPFAPPIPPPSLGGGFVDTRSAPPVPPNVTSSAVDSQSFGAGSNSFSGPPSSFGNGPPPFGNGPTNSNVPPNFSGGPPNLATGPGGIGAPPGFGPGNLQMTGPPGFGSGSGKPGPTVIRVQNMPFTVTVDEILDFFYGYQLIPGSVCLKYSEKGMPTGEAMVAFESRDEAMAAVVDLNDRPIGSRKVKLVLG
ncbi:RNA-binding protein 12 [Bombina bombina]|uniref:RNA-binding protein 12 n=1 Tax=Bombina bombina TaxID=8345 RepID=UPI00235A7B04|nr:RNA-binding protein 12 [Bombina bombina]XP_053551650.1 RNA-binding protein 12 [Bombina bombina]XP_053551724.1 RNA-binding protein 12 [Bombina bombina]